MREMRKTILQLVSFARMSRKHPGFFLCVGMRGWFGRIDHMRGQ